uniref:Uncharacterized protein n=1 Tax=Cucumis melo TaxID=3656 RepID=A0A9I9CI35_CUCME
MDESRGIVGLEVVELNEGVMVGDLKGKVGGQKEKDRTTTTKSRAKKKRDFKREFPMLIDKHRQFP